MKKYLAVFSALVVLFAPLFAMGQSATEFNDPNNSGRRTIRTGNENVPSTTTGQTVNLGTNDRWTTAKDIRTDQHVNLRGFSSSVIDVRDMPGQKYLAFKIPGNNVVNIYYAVDGLTASTIDTTNVYACPVGGMLPLPGTAAGLAGASRGSFALLPIGAVAQDSSVTAKAMRSGVVPLSMFTRTFAAGGPDTTSAMVPIDFPYIRIHIWSASTVSNTYFRIVGRKQ